MVKNVNTILVANRGEIALRVVRTAREMGIATVAVYAEQDRNAQYVEMADEAYLLPGDTYRDTYLNEGLMIDVLRRSGADAVHPGYGFLSEVASFAQKVIDAGAIWIGPSPQALTDLGDKITARRVAKLAKVPPVPGISDPVSDIRVLLEFAHTHGYPLMMKRTDGGGGRGIVLVHDDDELRGFYMSHDSLQGGDLNEYFVERFIDKARHVETQCGRDSHGNFTVYSTRDCSVQRRNQKLIEEAPAPFLSEDANEQLHRYSRNLFESVDYQGLGTCEFMVTGQRKVYFLEVNPRLQVEHTVSEEVCGLDLVREQIDIANGGELNQVQQPRGHSFELRITCEDPATNLTPSSGTLSAIRWPSGPGIRVDSGVEEGDTVSPKFDSMMGKLVITAQDRPTAVARVRRALQELSIEGVPTPASLYEQIFNDPVFTAEGHDFDVSTKWLEREYLNREPSTLASGQPASLSGDVEQPQRAETESFVIEMNDRRVTLKVPVDIVNTLTGAARARGAKRASQPLRGQGLHVVESGNSADQKPGVIASPMQAVITRVNVAEGQSVAKGDLLIVLESMKMENYVYAPDAGTVTKIFVGPSSGVEAGDTLITIDVDGDGGSNTGNGSADESTANKGDSQ
ncbi:acetyl/propionyl/methylcrotonyl-CoA carboxylase subunit alpha [Bifidobacterium sp.]|jgi:acetyl-CoA/propionyl-CoA carboxylase biotin carboxyl carrier protein|uniref:acetyl/propionyl/methylcrotonyl-CoA carboxylase subunit alpha n=1 Tax=Bifidobacterium sp. TaxID=41200 RepID=UPI0025BC31D8|nr:biotin carboxylase N-terminal domain-containing protein [Bifidobacterium sp.]MCH4209769.1 biotin/lipoyl-binding protein [Bifidobacterium sp.]MCI1224560.1 biotin/lipoyl-binding protein [Bifidobacterium sp.]